MNVYLSVSGSPLHAASGSSSVESSPGAVSLEGAVGGQTGAAGEPAAARYGYKTVDMCFIIGGMDTEGEIFDDCLVMLLKDDDVTA